MVDRGTNPRSLARREEEAVIRAGRIEHGSLRMPGE